MSLAACKSALLVLTPHPHDIVIAGVMWHIVGWCWAMNEKRLRVWGVTESKAAHRR